MNKQTERSKQRNEKFDRICFVWTRGDYFFLVLTFFSGVDLNTHAKNSFLAAFMLTNDIFCEKEQK